MSADRPAPVPLCDIALQYRGLQDEIDSAVLRVLYSGQAILGPEVTKFEEEAAAYCRAPYALGCASGTDAILLALYGLDMGPGDEVILPPFTFFATVGSIIRVGATPVFVDIDPLTFNIDPDLIEAKITPRTKAIMPVHLFGQCCDMDPIWDIADRHGLAVIEDAAQSFGAEYKDQRCGTLGVVSCFSFYPSKNLGTMGDAGMVTTNNAAVNKKMAAYRVHGSEVKYFHKYIGWNARLDAIQAAMLRVKLPHVDHTALLSVRNFGEHRQRKNIFRSLFTHREISGLVFKVRQAFLKVQRRWIVNFAADAFALQKLHHRIPMPRRHAKRVLVERVLAVRSHDRAV